MIESTHVAIWGPMPVVVDVVADEDKIEAYVPVSTASADYAGFSRMATDAQSRVEQLFAGRMKVVTRRPEDMDTWRSFDVRKGITRGMDLRVWLDGETVRLTARTMTRLDMAWGCLSLAAGLAVGLFCAIVFVLGMGPHLLHGRYWPLVALLTGGATALLVAILTWVPKQALSKGGRRESMQLGERAVREVAEAIHAAFGAPGR